MHGASILWWYLGVGGEYSPTLSLGKKWKTKLVGENYSCVRKRKELQDNHTANVIKTSWYLITVLFSQAASCIHEMQR